MATVDDVKASLDGVAVDVNFLKGFFGDVNVSGLSSAKSVEELFKLLGSELTKLFEAFVDAFQKDANKFEAAVKKIAKKIAELWQKIIALFQSAFKSVGALKQFPGALRSGPLAGFQAAAELTTLLSTSTNISNRIDAVADSFAELMKLAGGGGDLSIVSVAVDEFKDILKDLTTGGNAEEKLRKRLVSLLVPDETAIVKVVTKATEGKWWTWAELPSGLTPGDLHKWINVRSTYPSDSKLFAHARRFRCQLVMAVDGYLRTHVAAHDRMTSSDRRMSYQALTDVVAILIDQVVTFVFEPDDFPVTEEELDGFEDVGFGFSAALARQIRVAIRGQLGTAFRGAWEFSVHTDALAELFSTVVGVLFSSILEAVCRNLTWTIRVVSRYKGDPYGGAAGLFIADSLDRTSPVGGSGVTPRNVEYVAFLRNTGLNSAPPALKEFLIKILQDLAAYIDAGYQQFHKTRRLSVNPTDPSDLRELASFLSETSQQLMEIKLFPKIATDQIGSINYNFQGNTLTLNAQVLPIGTDFGNLPRPVVRGYFGNQMIVLAPGTTPSDDYSMQYTFDRLPRRAFKITVLSSRGGIGETTVS